MFTLMLMMSSLLNNKKGVVIIPVYNDHATIRQVIGDLVLQGPLTIIVVDDGSAVPVQQSLTGLPVILLRHRVNLGQGAALQTGFFYAKRLSPDIVFTFDADGQHAATDLAALAQPVLSGEADVAMGSRFLSAGNNMPLARRLILSMARFVNYLFSGILLSDAHNGLRAFSGKALEKIILRENRMAHASEVLFEIGRHKLRYREVPVAIQYTDYSLQKGQQSWDSIKVLFDLILHKLFQ